MLKRKDIAEAVIDRVDYPNKGHFKDPESGQEGQVKNAVEGQRVRFRVFKRRGGIVYGRLISVVERSPIETREPFCTISDDCGGCLYQRVPYEKQLEIKTAQLMKLMQPVLSPDSAFDGIKPSPKEIHYRNKLDFSFGDAVPGGPMTLGMHRRGTRYTVLNADSCALAHPDLTRIAAEVRDFCAGTGLPFFNKLKHEGFYRFLMLRRSETTGEILVCLAVTTQYTLDFSPLVSRLLALPLEGHIAGIFLADDDRLADALLPDKLHCLYGQDFFTEHILGLSFKVSLFSFFQTNTLGAEVLYRTVRAYVRESPLFAGGQQMDISEGKRPPENGKPEENPGGVSEAEDGTESDGTDARKRNEQIRKPVIYDLYAGTGTIGQMMAPAASHVYGIEIIPEAVDAANENAAGNGLANCTFLEGDVMEMLPALPERPDYIILDPPREGLHPKALKEIAACGVPNMVYISCKATSFVRDMKVLAAYGYEVRRWSIVDLFPGTQHAEVVALLSDQKQKPDPCV